MVEPCELPDLLNIFTKIVCERKEYCFVCLRTSEERRLVKAESFKKFVASAKINTNGNAHLVCHICERQASNALRLLRAAVFASSLSLILSELRQRDITCNKIMLETKFFKKVLAKVELQNKSLTPTDINKEVHLIRNNNLLSTTDVLVIDNKQETVIQCFKAPTCTTSPVPPDRLTTLEANKPQTPPPPETYVILDDEDETNRINTTNTEKELEDTLPPENQNVLTATTNLNHNLVITLDPPNLIPFEDLLTQQSKKHTKFLLHPIFLSDIGGMYVPSLSAIIINDLLIFQDALKQTRRTRRLKVNMDIVKQTLKAKREVFIQNYNKMQMAAVNSNLENSVVDNNCQSDFSVYPQKKMKTDENLPKDGKNIEGCSNTINNSNINNIQISDIRSDLDNAQVLTTGASKTDWEDKIPMDIISFVDAVDPNAHEVLKEMVPIPCDRAKVGRMPSLSREQTMDVDVIDLC